MLALYPGAGDRARHCESACHRPKAAVLRPACLPGPRLERLHQRILVADPSLAGEPTVASRLSPAPPATPPATYAARPVAQPAAGDSISVTASELDVSQYKAYPPPPPRQLPGAAAHFTGRTAELAALDGMLEHADGQLPGSAAIIAIGGTAG